MNNLDNLRAFLRDGPFNLSKVAEKIGIQPKVLSDFIHKTRTDKNGDVHRVGLGIHEDKTFAYFQRYGYDPNVAYEAVI